MGKVHLNNALSTKSADPLSLLKRRGSMKSTVLDIHKKKGTECVAADNVLRFDDLLGLVNDIERDHLLKLKAKVHEERKAQPKMQVQDEKRLQKIVYDHFKKSRGLVKKIKNIKHRKRQKRARRDQATKRKGKRYQARFHHKLTMKKR